MVISSELGKQKSPSVADVRIVHPELMPVISKRQRLLQIIWKRFEPAKVRGPFFVGEPGQSHRLRRLTIEEAGPALWESCRLYWIEESISELKNPDVWLINHGALRQPSDS